MRKTAPVKRSGRTAPVRKKKVPLYQRVELLLALVVLLGVPVAFAGYALQSSLLKVQRVRFDGVRIMDENDILRAARITVDDNILLLNTDAIVNRVEALPYVKLCEVKRMFFKEVELRIVERRPTATIMVNNHLFEVDRELVVLRELSPFSVHTGPLITNLPDLEVLQPGTQLASPELKAALELWEVFQSLALADELTLSELSAAHLGALYMYFENLPYEMRWGRSDFETQVARLAILWDEMNGIIPCDYYLDLRFDADLVCK